MKKLILCVFFTGLVILSGCSSHVQTTSGRAYLAKYMQQENIDEQDQEVNQSHLNGSDSIKIKSKNVDQLIREVATVEPTLRFPARIGLARVERGYLSSIPEGELEAWDISRKKLGPSFGEFVPINPLIADMVVENVREISAQGYSHRVKGVVNKIRLGAARQHLDAVLIYEIYSKEDSTSNLLAIANLTILGAYVLPSKSVTTQGFANAMLVDVIQGYPYGTAQATLDKNEMASTFGRHEKQRQLSEQIKSEVTAKLTEEVETMFRNLQIELMRVETDYSGRSDQVE